MANLIGVVIKDHRYDHESQDMQNLVKVLLAL